MAKVFKGIQAFLGAFDISAAATGFEPGMQLEIRDYRPFNSNAVRKEPGMRSDSAKLSGCFEFDDAGGNALFTGEGLEAPFSAHVDQYPAAEGDSCLFFDSIQGSIQAAAKQGDLQAFDLTLGPSGPIVFGKTLAAGDKSATGNGAGVSLPAVAAGQKIFAISHLVAISGAGATYDLTIESSADAGFSSPVTRFTFTQLGAIGSQFLELDAGSGITDTYWRAVWTLAGTGPQVTVAVALGIV